VFVFGETIKVVGDRLEYASQSKTAGFGRRSLTSGEPFFAASQFQ